MKTNGLSRSTEWLNHADRTGAVLSSLCAIHCICMPIVIGILPVVGLSFLADEQFERIAAISVIILAALCLWSGCRMHQKWSLFSLLAIAATLIISVQFGAELEAEESGIDWYEAIAMMVGGVLIAAAHIINLKLRKHCPCVQCDDKP